MCSLISRMRRQTGVYWAFQNTESGGAAYDGDGQPLYTDPVEIECRWDDLSEQFIDYVGTEQVSRSLVYVDRDMKPGEVLFLGELTDLDSEDVPKDNEGAWEIRKFEKNPNLRNTETLRTAYL